MVEVPAEGKEAQQFLDVCTTCQFVWFDSREYDAMPSLPRTPAPDEELPAAAREKLALMEVERLQRASEEGGMDEEPPEEWWQWIPGILGMPVEHETSEVATRPWVTWGLALAVMIVSGVAFFNLPKVVAALGFIPAQSSRYGGLTFVTSFFVHGGIIHLLSNMYFFVVFGDNVEDYLGKARFLLLILCATVFGDILHAIGDPRSTVPCVGASGGISGIITFYALAFPRAQLGIAYHVWAYVRWIRMPAYAMFLIWIGMQAVGTWSQLAGVSDVSSLAHLGGAAIGFIFWLVNRAR